MVTSERATLVKTSVFENASKAVDLELSRFRSEEWKVVDHESFRFRKKKWKEEERVEGLVKNLAETIKGEIPPLVAVEVKHVNAQLFEVIEYSLLDFKLYKSERYSDDLAILYEYPKKKASRELSTQTLQNIRDYSEGWLEGYGEKAIDSLRKAYRDRKKQVPTFSITSISGRALEFAVIPQPTRGTFFEPYREEIGIMMGRGEKAQRAYSAN